MPLSAADPTARLLDAAIHSLRSDILPLLDDDVARMRVDHITRLLRNVAARLTRREAGLAQMIASAAAAGLPSPPQTDDSSLAAREQQRIALDTQITAALPALLDAIDRGEPAALDQLASIVALQKDFYVGQDPDIARGSVVVYRGGRIDAEPQAAATPRWPAINEDHLSAYLRRHFARDTVRAEQVRLIPGGFSKETVFFTLVDDADGTRRELVMRKDMPYPFIDRTVVNEIGVLQALHARGFPVAKPLWLEAGVDHFGGAFLVSERVAGTSNAVSWTADTTRARQACDELARVLAALHRQSPKELGYTAERCARSAGELMTEEIAVWTRLFHTRRCESFPLQELPLLWLARNIPAELFQRPACVVHGDFGFHNLMFDEHGKITALLDWEFSGLGDPTQDLCFVRLFVEPLMPWADFLQRYADYGGVAFCESAAFFFDLWTKTRNSIGCVASQKLFDVDLPQEMKFALTGHVFGPYLHIDECESLLAHLRQHRA